MHDQNDLHDLRLEAYLAAERRRAERDFPRIASRIERSAASATPRPSSGLRRTAPVALVVLVALVAGSAGLARTWFAGSGGAWVPERVDAIGLGDGTPTISVILDGETALLTGHRSATIEELTAHRSTVNDSKVALIPLPGDEWLLRWIGTRCDAGARLDVRSASLTLSTESEESCTWSTDRGVVLRFASGVDPSTLELALAYPPAPLDASGATRAAIARATIPGPLTIVNATTGTYGSFEHPALPTPAPDATQGPGIDPERIVWAVDLENRDGARERLFLDLRTGELLVAEQMATAQAEPPASPLAEATPLTIATESGTATTVRIVVVGDVLDFIDGSSGRPVAIVWPAGWSARRIDGRGELLDPAGRVVALEGELFGGYGGGIGTDGAFHVCIP
jgi:hypothetical protein